MVSLEINDSSLFESFLGLPERRFDFKFPSFDFLTALCTAHKDIEYFSK